METNDRVEEIAERIAMRLDGRTVTSHEHYRQMLKKELVHELTNHDQSRHTSLVKAVEGKRIKDLPSSVQDPGGFCRGLGYNRSLDDTLTIINSIFKE